MALSPKDKENLGLLAKFSGAAALVGGFVHLGHYAALGFVDTKISQALRAGKEFIPDGFAAIVGTVTSVTNTWWRHPIIVTFVLALGGSLVALLRLKKSPALLIAAFTAVSLLVVLLCLPAFQVFDVLEHPPDPADLPPTRIAQWLLQPVISAVIFSRIQPPDSKQWDPLDHRAILNARFAMLVFATLVLWLLSLLVPVDNKTLKQWTGPAALAALIMTAYYYGAIQADTHYNRAIALAGHTHTHSGHTAYVLSIVGDTYSVFSFDYGNEDIDKKYVDADERKEDVLEFRLNHRSLARLGP